MVRGRHTAGGSGGTYVLNALLGERNLFPFPKSVYAVRDCLRVAVGNRPNALILDFFAGSGTTLHAALLMNRDGGNRRCIMVTNNEVAEATARSLASKGIYRGDPQYEAMGIFEKVTRPRCEAAVTGRRPDGTAAEGQYIDGKAYAEGFEENVEFFRVDYLDPDEIDLGTQFEAIHPSLWLSAGGIGARPKSRDADMMVSGKSNYAILFRDDRFNKFTRAISAHSQLTHVWIVTDSEDAFAEMRAALDSRLRVSMLYRDYLRTFKINTSVTA